MIASRPADDCKRLQIRPLDVLFRHVGDAVQMMANDQHLLLPDRLGVSLSSGEGLIKLVRDASEDEDKDGVSNDPGVLDKRKTLVVTEFTAALAKMKGNENTLSQMLRDAWDAADENDVLRPATKTTPIKATCPHLNVIGHTTKGELLEMLRAQDYQGGLVNRFLWPCVARTRKVSRPPRMDKKALESVALELARSIRAYKQPVELTLTAGAEALWDASYDELSKDMPTSRFSQSLDRTETYAWRIAAIYAALAGSMKIDVDHLKAGIACVNFNTACCRYLFDKNPEGDTQAEQLLRALAAAGKDGLSQTQISGVFNRNIRSEVLKEMIESLIHSGKVEKFERQGSGRKTTGYRVI